MSKNNLSIPKGMKVKKPGTEPHMISKRGVPYWFAPYWVRDLAGNIGRIIPLKTKSGDVELNMLSKDGSVSYIQGSIQKEFKKWHEDQQLDAILLGLDEDDIIATQWEYE
jgi:hypothetical protein